MITAILLAGLSQCLVLAGFLYYKSKHHPRFNLLLIIHIIFAADLFLLVAQQELWIENRINACWGALYAILYFIFIRTCLGVRTSKMHILAYFLPWFALNLSVLDFLINPKTTELVIRHQLSGHFLLAIYLFFAVGSCVTVYRYQTKREDYLANLSQQNVWLLWGICASLFLAITAIPFQHIYQTDLPLPQMLVSVVMFVVTYLLLLNPELLNFETFNTNDDSEQTSTNEFDAEIAKQIINLLDEQQAFKDPELSLQSLANQLGIKPYIISQVLNQYMGIRFYDLVNRRRVKFTCELIEQYPNKALLEIALQAGFNSKSTFNSVFKKYQSVTPSQYKSNIGNRGPN